MKTAPAFLSFRSLPAIAACCAALLFWVPQRGQAAGSAPALREVIVVFKTHFDIGYTEMASNVVQRYRTKMIDDALKVVDENRSLPPEQQFVWTVPGWPATQIAGDWPGQSPERQERVRRAFKEGRFVVHALPFTTHTELFEPEDLVRGMGYSTRLARQLSLQLPRDAKMTDVPCHSWILPTLLRHAGVDFLHLGCNAASSSPRVPPLFWWEGPDGSQLLTFYSASGYGTGLLPPAGWPYRTWLALIQTGDNHGPPRPDEVGKLLAEAKEKLPGVKVRIGRLSDFADAIRTERASIPVVRGDMPDTWIHGPMCDPAGARLARNLRPQIGITEALRTELGYWKLNATAAKEGYVLPSLSARLLEPWEKTVPALEAAREQSLLYGEHTWGGALGWVVKYSQSTEYWYGEAWKQQRAAARFQKLEASWTEHSAYIEKARQLIQPATDQTVSELARSIKVPGERIAVFNPLPWKRDGLVTLAGGAGIPASQPLTGSAVKPVDGDEIIPVWTQGDSLCFVARDLPPTGYRTYQFTASRPAIAAVQTDESRQTIESPFFRAVLDPARGTIASLIDRRTGRELVAQSSASGLGQFLYERFASNNVAEYVRSYVKINSDWAVTELGKPSLPPAKDVPYRAVTPAGCSLRLEQTLATVTAVLDAAPGSGLPCPVSLRLTLYADLPYADLEITVQDKPADPWPEAGWLCLPFNIDSPRFRVGRLGAITDPTSDFVPGANHDLGAVHTGIALFDDRGRGVGLCPLDSPLASFDRPGCFQYAPEFTPRRANVFINLFNNQWTTNFRLWNSGTWTSRVRLWSFKNYDSTAALIAPSLEVREPLLAALANGAPGSLPPTQRGLALSKPGVAVTAFGPNPDGTGIVLRLWEYSGQSGTCRVQLPPGLTAAAAQPIDLRGRPVGKPIALRHDTFATQISAFAPASFRLE